MKPSQKKILVTAGPTREMLDPVRFLSNLSTGEMGYAVAREARSKGYEVTLISGPTHLQPPRGVRFVSVTSAAELKKACETHFPRHPVLVMTAAVCDFTARARHSQKISRTRIQELRLKHTPDIVAGLARKKGNRLVIGFCLETSCWLERARAKLRKKHLDGIVANRCDRCHDPFGNQKVTVAFLDRGPRAFFCRDKSKREIAASLLRWIEQKQARKRGAILL